MRWAVLVEYMKGTRNLYKKFVSTNVKGRHRWGDLGVNGSILKLM
jgi:hypothetical protein